MSKCLSCKHWQKDEEDGIVGKCTLLDELRFQFETENMFCKYEFGEDRKPIKAHYCYRLPDEKPKQTTPKTTPYYQIKAAQRKQARAV